MARNQDIFGTIGVTAAADCPLNGGLPTASALWSTVQILSALIGRAEVCADDLARRVSSWKVSTLNGSGGTVDLVIGTDVPPPPGGGGGVVPIPPVLEP
jgi:hypothetical protein